MASGEGFHGGRGAPSNYGHDNSTQERQSIRADQDMGLQRGVVPASDRENPANAGNLINPAGHTGADAEAVVRSGVRIVTHHVGGASRVVPALDAVNFGDVAPFGVGGNPAVVIQTGVGVIANALGAAAYQANAQLNLGVDAPAGQPPAQLNPGGVAIAPVGQAPRQRNLAGLAPAQLNLGDGAAAGQPLANPAVGEQFFDIEAGLSGPPLRRSGFGSII